MIFCNCVLVRGNFHHHPKDPPRIFGQILIIPYATKNSLSSHNIWRARPLKCCWKSWKFIWTHQTSFNQFDQNGWYHSVLSAGYWPRSFLDRLQSETKTCAWVCINMTNTNLEVESYQISQLVVLESNFISLINNPDNLLQHNIFLTKTILRRFA